MCLTRATRPDCGAAASSICLKIRRRTCGRHGQCRRRPDQQGRVINPGIGQPNRDGALAAACEDSSGAVWLYLSNGQLWRYKDGSTKMFLAGADQPTDYRRPDRGTLRGIVVRHRPAAVNDRLEGGPDHQRPSDRADDRTGAQARFNPGQQGWRILAVGRANREVESKWGSAGAGLRLVSVVVPISGELTEQRRLRRSGWESGRGHLGLRIVLVQCEWGSDSHLNQPRPFQ